MYDGDFTGDPGELDGYTEVTGSVDLRNLAAADLSGMDCLRTIGGILGVSEMPNLSSLDGLGPVERVDSLILTLNPELADISALAPLRTVESKIRIVENPKLAGIDALNGIESTVGDIELWDNAELMFGGLGGVTTVSGTVSIQRNPVLGGVGLEGLAAAEWIQIADNDALTALGGMESVQEIEFGVRIYENDELSNVAALMDAELMHLQAEIEVRDNPKLPQCDVEALAEALKPAGWMGTEDLSNNQGTCP